MPKRMTEGFEFKDGNRVFTCTVEPLRPTKTASTADTWWWFRVSTETSHRYAPFRHEPGDTRGSVQSRIVAYYDELLVRRAQPATTHWARRGRPPGNATPQTPATDTTASA